MGPGLVDKAEGALSPRRFSGRGRGIVGTLAGYDSSSLGRRMGPGRNKAPQQGRLVRPRTFPLPSRFVRQGCAGDAAGPSMRRITATSSQSGKRGQLAQTIQTRCGKRSLLTTEKPLRSKKRT